MGSRALIVLVAALLALPAACSTRPATIGAAAAQPSSGGPKPGTRVRLAAGAEPLWAADAKRPVVALTFDDGPDPRWTPTILTELQREHVRATFFVLGSSVRAHPGLLAREARLGEQIGCHGWDHRLEVGWTKAATLRAFRACAAMVERVGRERPTFARAPYGLLRDDQVAALRGVGLTVVDWNLSVSPILKRPDLLNTKLAKVRSGTILLLHDGRGNRSSVVRLVPRLVRGLRARGFDMVTLDQLLAVGGGTIEPGQVECNRLRLYRHNGIVPRSALHNGLCVA